MTIDPKGVDRALGPSARATYSDELLAALTEENARLRKQNRQLTGEVMAMRLAQADLAKHLRATAPLRRVQEHVRMRATQRRRAEEQSVAETVRATRPASSPDAPSASLAISEGQAARHPLLARTRSWQHGLPLDPVPALRPIRQGRAGRVAVVVHVYYPSLWPELAARIARIPAPVDLIVTLVAGHSDALARVISAQFPEVLIEVLPNRGRDMWPFVHVLELGLVGDHDAVLKLHTKASVHRVDGAAWRARLLDSLCPSPERIGLMLELLRCDDAIGMLAPEYAVLGSEFWGSNGLLVDALAARTGIDVNPARVWYPGGSMFWARPGPLLRLRRAGITEDDFEHEAVSIDGTAAHALERFVGALVTADGLEVLGVDEVGGRLAQSRSAHVVPSGQPHHRSGSRGPRGPQPRA